MKKWVRLFLGLGRKDLATASVDSATIKAYNNSREILSPKYLCHAPFNNMYFNSLGDVSMCWLTFDNPDRYSESHGIRDIWFGERFNQMRKNIKEQNLESRCKTCQKHLEDGNFTNVLATAYDNKYPLGKYPTVMELELSNTCNLECAMCTGLLSSSIRKNRDKLPPLKSPYADSFVEELREFIPHLREIRFNGGEPFLIPIYYKIWDAVFELNPKIRMVIATNGTVLNNRVKSYLSKGNFHLNISIDALEPSNYASIRVNGNPTRLMDNFIYFRDYCRANNRTLCVMINPMRKNWQEMPDFVDFCNTHGVHLWFNTIVRPYDQALWNLDANEIQTIYAQLTSAELKPNPGIDKGLYKYNVNTYLNLVQKQIKTWLSEALVREKDMNKLDYNAETNVSIRVHAYFGDKRTAEAEELLRKLKEVAFLASESNRGILYKMVLDSNPETLLQIAREKSTEELFSLFKQELKS